MHYSALALLQKWQLTSIDHRLCLINLHTCRTQDTHLAPNRSCYLKKVADKLVYRLTNPASKLVYCLTILQESVDQVVYRHLDHHLEAQALRPTIRFMCKPDLV